MNKELEKLNTPHSPPLVSSAMEDLRSQHMLQKIGLLPQKWITLAAAHYTGCALVWLSPSHVLLSSLSEELDCRVDMPIPTAIDLVNVQSNISLDV